MRDKATSLPAVAAATAMLGFTAGLAAPATGPHASGTAGTARARLTSLTRTIAPPRNGAAPVAPLHGLRQADMIVVAPTTLPAGTLHAISRLPGVSAAQSVEAARVKLNGRYTAVLGVDPSTFRGYAAKKTAAATALWQKVADGAVAVSYTMGQQDRLPLGGSVRVAGARRDSLRVGGFGTVGIQGIDAVVSHSVARSLGMPAGNAIVISAPRANLASLAAAVQRVIPHRAAVQPLMSQVTAGVTTTQADAAGVAASGGTESPAAVNPAASPLGAPAGGTSVSQAGISAMIRAAESKLGLPYVWGAAGPGAFDCSGLVQWSFAQAGVRMPRVAADQARTGPAVPVSQLQPGDLLFYHTDPTDPAYISHVAIYIGNGEMLQAPETGMNVEVVPAITGGSEFAGAVRVAPALAAAVAGSI